MHGRMDYFAKPECPAMKALVKISLCLSALGAASPGDADELGRLFYTPEQRALLDRGQHAAADEPESVDSVTINGIVQKHGGERTIWINGVPRLAGKGEERSPESAAVAVPGKPNKIRAKVGQKIPVNPDAGEQ